MQFLSFKVLASGIKAIRFMMADKSVPKRKKLLVIGGIVYLFLPIDLIPALVFPFSLIDDVVVWALILWYLSSELDKYWMGEKTKDFSKRYKSDKVVDDVEFEVMDEEEQEKK